MRGKVIFANMSGSDRDFAWRARGILTHISERVSIFTAAAKQFKRMAMTMFDKTENESKRSDFARKFHSKFFTINKYFSLRFGTLAIPFTPPCQCLSDETLKAVGPFYLVSMSGEVKDPTSPHWNV